MFHHCAEKPFVSVVIGMRRLALAGLAIAITGTAASTQASADAVPSRHASWAITAGDGHGRIHLRVGNGIRCRIPSSAEPPMLCKPRARRNSAYAGSTSTSGSRISSNALHSGYFRSRRWSRPMIRGRRAIRARAITLQESDHRLAGAPVVGTRSTEPGRVLE